MNYNFKARTFSFLILIAFATICDQAIAPDNQPSSVIQYYLFQDSEIEGASSNSTSYSFTDFTTTTPSYFDCNGTKYLGGYNIVKSNSKITLRPIVLKAGGDPYQIGAYQINATIIFGDYWGPNAKLTLYNGATNASLITLKKIDIINAQKLDLKCGNLSQNSTSEDYIYHFSATFYLRTISVKMNDPKAKIIWELTKDTGDSGWFAIRNLTLTIKELVYWTCPIGTYQGQSLLCATCEPSCHNCSNFTFCLTCKSNFTVKNGKCIKTCTLYQYFDQFLLSCQPCHSTCKTCTGPKDYQCLTCDDTMKRYFYYNYCLNCSEGQYFDTTENVCTSCHDTCADCTGSLDTKCTKCNPPDSLSAGKCQPCPTGNYFFNKVSSICECKYI